MKKSVKKPKSTFSPKKTLALKEALVTILILLSLAVYAFSNSNKHSEAFSLSPLTQDQKFILGLNKSDASAKKANYDLISRTAQESKILEIKDCEVRPVVLKVKLGASFKAINHDLTDHVIATDIEHRYRVPAGQGVDLLADFGHGNGIYSLTCDNSDSLSGLFFVTN
jgi:hypothetical protein